MLNTGAFQESHNCIEFLPILPQNARGLYLFIIVEHFSLAVDFVVIRSAVKDFFFLNICFHVFFSRLEYEFQV